MYSFRRLALVVALSLPAAHLGLAQDASSSSTSATPSQAQEQTQQPSATSNQAPMSVQARIRARREQRRAQAIRDVYSQKYEAFVGMGYLRFSPGSHLQKVTYYAWDSEFTKYRTERLGITLDARGYYGTPFVGLNFSGITRPAISTYAFLGGPTYRFYMQPKYSISGRVMAGYAHGNFSGDTNGFGGKTLGLYADGGTFAGSASIIGEYNVSPGLGLRLASDYFPTGFGSSVQNSLGWTGGFVFRFGKQ